MAQLLLQQGKVIEALKYFERAAELSRTEGEIANALEYAEATRTQLEVSFNKEIFSFFLVFFSVVVTPCFNNELLLISFWFYMINRFSKNILNWQAGSRALAPALVVQDSDEDDGRFLGKSPKNP